MKNHIKFILPYILLVIMMYISYDMLMPGKDIDKLFNNIIANIEEDVLYTNINYGEHNDENPVEAYIFTKQEHSIKIFRLLPKYGNYGRLRGLKINDISVFDISSQDLSVFFSTDDILNKHPQFVESFADSSKLIASITPYKGMFSRVFLFGIKKDGDSVSYLSTNEVRNLGNKELYEYPLEKENIFVVEELKFDGIPNNSSESIYNLWNYYRDDFNK